MKKDRSIQHANLVPNKYKYNDDVPRLLLEFFDRELFQEIDGKTYPSPLPTVEGFCKTLYISKSTFHEWEKREPALRAAYKVAKNFQYEQLIYLTQIGFYKEGISKMLAYNLTDLKTEQQLANEASESSDDSKRELTLNYNFKNKLPEKTE